MGIMKRKKSEHPILINVPIEPLPMRYTMQWDEWFMNAFRKEAFETVTVTGTTLTNTVKNGSFLDACSTHMFKFGQLQKIVQMAHRGQLDNGAVIFFHDAWFPGMECLAYIRDIMKLNLKFIGCLHSGTYDPTDFISRAGMSPWGEHLENSWFRIYDELFVATEYHRAMLHAARPLSHGKVAVTGFPLMDPVTSFPSLRETRRGKENIIVFPHRLVGEKNPAWFDFLQMSLSGRGWDFVKTHELKLTKSEYYALLSKAKVAVSFSEHENWGISMIEATMLGCVPLVPDNGVYRELYESRFRYPWNGVQEVMDTVCGIIPDIIENYYDNAWNIDVETQAYLFREEYGNFAMQSIVRHINLHLEQIRMDRRP